MVLAGAPDQMIQTEYKHPNSYGLRCDRDGRVVVYITVKHQTSSQKLWGYSSVKNHSEMLPGHWIS